MSKLDNRVKILKIVLGKLLTPQYRPTPDIRELFKYFNEKFFDAKLKNVNVEWSRRMTVTVGFCYYKDDGCLIKLS